MNYLKILMLAGSAISVHSATLSENFENFEPRKSIDKQDGWGERAYGRHPSCKVELCKDKQNLTKVLVPTGSGDRHVYKKYESKDFQAIMTSKIVVFDFSYKRNAQVELAPAGKYNSGKRLLVKCSNKISVLFDKNTYPGILKVDDKQWNDVRLIIENVGQESIITAAYRIKGTDKYIVDPELNNLKIPLNQSATKYWNGYNIRIDGGGALDDLMISSYKSLGEIPDKMVHQEASLPFLPILDHLTPRRQSISLCGKWTYYVAKDGMMPGKSQTWNTLIIPDDHSGIINSAGKGCVFFRKEFKLASIKKKQKTFICFERVTDSCEVFINGHKAGGSTDGHFPFKIDVSSFVRNGNNILTVKVLGPKATSAYKNRPQGWSWFLGKFAGIPYPVHIEISGMTMIDDVFVKPHVGQNNSLETEITVTNFNDADETVTVKAIAGNYFSCSGKPVVIPAGKSITVNLNGDWKNPRLWWPHDPHLYYLTLELSSGGKVIDSFKQRFGFREMKVAGDVITLNNRRMLHRRNSIIPYWNRTDKKSTLEMFNMLKERGYNGSRLHGGSSLRMIRTADEFGWLMSPESAINEPRGHQVTREFWPVAREHLRAMVKTFRNNPSVVYWCLSNEFASYYMKGTTKQKAEVDARMLEFGDMVKKLDPTRTWTCSGDGELGGVGQHGAAPTLSFHYAWQPFKPNNMIPNTVYWLSEGKKPWQGIAWDKKKPVMLSEDLYPPYALKPPQGISLWGGEKAFSMAGMVEAWREGYMMLCDGYYYAPVSCWNPWGTFETVAANPLYKLGQLMPDYHIAVKELNVTFSSGDETVRTIYIYNQLFKDREFDFEAKLLSATGTISTFKDRFSLNGGDVKSLELKLRFPKVDRKTELTCKMNLSAQGEKLAAKNISFTVYPENHNFRVPPRTALVGQPLPVPGITSKHSSLREALNTNPANLVMAACKPLTEDEGLMLSKAVEAGLNVLWLEIPVNGWKPCKIYPGGIAAFNFVRAPEDPCMAGVDNNDLKLWRPNALAAVNTIIKPDDGEYDILTDCFNGLSRTSLMRKYSGRGSWLLCQLPIVDSWNREPAARYVFRRLLSALDKPGHSGKYLLGVATPTGSTLPAALKKIKLPFANSTSSHVLMLDGATPLSQSLLNSIRSCCQRGGIVFIDEPDQGNVKRLSAFTGMSIGINPSRTFQMIKENNGGLFSGLSNGDLYWSRFADAIYKKYICMMQGKEYESQEESMLSGELAVDQGRKPVTPAGVAILPFADGKIILSTVKWRKFLSIKSDLAKRYICTLLHNLNVKTSAGNSVINYNQLDISNYTNRSFQNNANSRIKGWFGQADDDIRYFPVNRTGIDPKLHVPCPVETFPDEPVNYGGIDFKLVNSENNRGTSCIVLLPNQTVSIKLGLKADRIWMLGALNDHLKTETKVATVTFKYSDGSSADTAITSGVHVNGFQYLKECTQGIAAWNGKTPKRDNAVLWSWSIPNPYPKRLIASISLNMSKQSELAVIGITAEQQTSISE